MAYNLTGLAQSSTIYELVVYSNNITTGLLMIMFILAFFFIMLMSLKRYEFDVALLVSSFLSFIISTLLVYAELLPLTWALIFLAFSAFSAMFVFIFK